jgi:hypothetical protein
MRNSELRAIFENWKLPNGVVLPGKFTIELVGKVRGRNYRYYPVLFPTRIEFRDHEGSRCPSQNRSSKRAKRRSARCSKPRFPTGSDKIEPNGRRVFLGAFFFSRRP